MRVRSFGFIISVLLSGPFFSGCAGGGSSGTNPVPSTRTAAAGLPSTPATRRSQNVPGCTGTGAGGFEGGGAGNAVVGADSAVVAGTGNEACDPSSAIVGGSSNTVQSASGANGFVGGGSHNYAMGADTFIGAGSGNGVVDGNLSSIVGGMGNAIETDKVFIGGGESNKAGGVDSVIVGGSHNQVAGEYAAVAAGLQNYALGDGAFVGAGGYNIALSEGAVIGGGFTNDVLGKFATIPGGYGNAAWGTYSFAGGAFASALQAGTFVWSDGSNGDTALNSSRAYQFLARASGGVTFWTNAAGTVGATLAPGSGTWASASDRTLKTDVARIDDAAVLAKVDALPIDRWSYRSERGVRHVGPMAQDFYAAFKVGEDDKHITSIDEDGVALAAIKALHAENAQLRRELVAERVHDRRVDTELRNLARRSSR